MFRIDNSTATGAMPAPAAAGQEGYFTDGDPAGGTPATIVPADWLNLVQEEILAVIEGAGIAPDKAATDQLLAGIVATVGKVGIGQGRHTVSVPAVAMRPSASGGCSPLSEAATGAGQPTRYTLDFDATVEQAAEFVVPMPASWDEGDFTVLFIYTQDSAGAGDVVWGAEAVAVGGGESLATAFGTAVKVTDTATGTVNGVRITPESAALTPAGAVAPGDLVAFRIFRAAGAAGDTLGVPAGLLGVAVIMTINGATD